MIDFTSNEISFLISTYENQSKGFKPFMLAAGNIPSLIVIWLNSSVSSTSLNGTNKFPWLGFILVLSFQAICYFISQHRKRICKSKRSKLLLPISFQFFFQISMLFFVVSILNLVFSIIHILLNSNLLIKVILVILVFAPIVWSTGWIFARFRLHEFMKSTLYNKENNAIPKIISIAGPLSISLVTAIILLRNANIENIIYIFLSVIFLFISYFLSHYLGYHFRVLVSYIHFVFTHEDTEINLLMNEK